MSEFMNIFSPVSQYFGKPHICEVMVNGDETVHISHINDGLVNTGKKMPTEDIRAAIKWVAGKNDIDCNDNHPVLECTLPNTYRITAMLPPVSEPSFTIRIPLIEHASFSDFIHKECPYSIEMFQQFIEYKHTILVAGATASGKTSFINACLNEINYERVVKIEDRLELVQTENCVSLLERKDIGVSMANLLKLSLSLRPDRIIVGEIRDGYAAWQFLNAIRKGHKGSFSTIHAGSCDEALDNLFMMIHDRVNSSISTSIQEWISKLIDVVVFLNKRKIMDIKVLSKGAK
ncbi:MAG: type IV secretion system protein VirB11 [Candidatus Magnetoglobus multicellularis str. Araruama]|uniref:Type IV secretion system protein VirB11 n=1 Tax=Candidatus Magnetoglobus multicellularis str. Araruama TaxID=890399 RepID=A0A1V1PAH1_9BACT|nr:MAG: type IV secretion system protein VirB11 [Candidatus Magnetoglobus multicellularis str. Araruama]